MKKLGFFIFLLGLYCAGWFIGARYLENKLEKFQKMQHQQFREISYDKVVIKGFPLRYELHFDHPSFKGPVKNLGLEIGGDLNIQWQAEKCVAMIKLWNWRTFTVVIDGPSICHLTREAHPGFTVGFQKLQGKIFLNHHRRCTQFHLETQLPTLSHFKGQSLATAEKWTIDFRRGHQMNPEGEIVIDKFEGILDQLNIPGKTVIDHARLQGTILNPFSRGPLIRGLKIWRDDGGTVEINQLDVQWKNIAFNMKGTLSLDGNLRPLAAMVVTLSDYTKILETLVTEKWLKPKEALTAGVALSFLKKPASNTIEIPLSIQEGKMSIGPLIFSPIPSLEDVLKV